jgi:hypothetical protein
VRCQTQNFQVCHIGAAILGASARVAVGPGFAGVPSCGLLRTPPIPLRLRTARQAHPANVGPLRVEPRFAGQQGGGVVDSPCGRPPDAGLSATEV